MSATTWRGMFSFPDIDVRKVVSICGSYFLYHSTFAERSMVIFVSDFMKKGTENFSILFSVSSSYFLIQKKYLPFCVLSFR